MIKLGFIGCGRMASYHAEVLKNLDAKIVSACGRENSERAKEFAQKYNAPEVYRSRTELTQNSKVDAFWVTTPPEATEEILIPLIKTQVPIFVEKPVALNSKKIEDAIRTEKEYKNKVFVGMNRRFYDFIPELKEYIKNYELKSVEIALPEQLNDKNLKEEEQDTVWFTNSIHELDLIYHLLGPIDVLYSHKYKTNTAKSYNCLFESKKIPIQLNACWNSPWNKTIRFFFDKYVIELCPIETMKIYQGVDKFPATKNKPINQFKPNLVKETETSMQYKPGIYEQDKNIINHLKNNFANKSATLEDAYKINSLIEDILNKSK